MLQVSKWHKRLFAFLVGFMMIVSQSSYLSLTKVYAEPNDSGATETVYMLTDTLEDGQNYLVASGEADTVSILDRDSKEVTSAQAEVISDANGIYIKSAEKSAVWTAKGSSSEGLQLVNGDYAVYADSNELILGDTEEGGSWTYESDTNYLSAGGTDEGDAPSYMIYDNGFEAADNGGEISLYVETQIEKGIEEEANTERGPPAEDEDATVEEEAASETDSEATEEEPSTKAEKPAAKAAGTKAAANGDTILTFSSDVHNTSGNSSANRMSGWIDTVEGIYDGNIDAMGFGGDMAGAGASNYWTHAQADMDVLTNKGVTGVYTTGNHEISWGGDFSYTKYQNGEYTADQTEGQFQIGKQGKEGDNYRIYCLGSTSGSQGYTTDQISTLESYLNSVGNDKPIFIITHFPLHYTTSRTTSNAGTVIDKLNTAAASGKKIVFLWGHNHTDVRENNQGSETNYDEIFKPDDELTYASGSKKTIQFYYAAAGCMSDSDYGTGSGAVKGKGLAVTINNKKQLTFTYYDTSGNDVTEGGSYTEKDPVAVTGMSIDTPETTEVEVGKTIKLSATVEPSDATIKKVTWESNKPGVATVDSSGKVKGISAGTATITATLNDTTNINRGGVFTDEIEITVLPRSGNSPMYVLTNTLEPDKNYIIANKNSGEAYALTNNSGSVSKTTVNVDGETIYLDDDDLVEKLVFTTEGSGSTVTAIGNNGRYLSASNSSLTLATSAPTNRTFAYGTDNKLTVKGSGSSSSTYYIYYSTYNNGNYSSSTSSSSSTSPREVYLYEEVKEQVAVQSVTVDPTSKTIQERTSTQLTATVLPENATNKKVTWESSNTGVAKVDENGKVRGVGEGTATITVRSVADTTKYATATITVTPNENPQPTYVIVIDGYAMSVNRSPNTANGGSSSYTYTGLKGVEYASGDAATDEIRWIIEETTGGYYIQDLDGNYLNATYVSGTNSGTGDLKLDDTKDVWVLDSGYSLTDGTVDGSKLKSTNASSTATSDKFLSYEDSQNLFSVRSEGNADTISIVEAEDPIAVTGITVNPNEKTIEARTTTQLTATVAPEDATNKKVTWESSNTSIATVNDNGVVRGVSEGTVTITAKSVSNPDITGTATITVIPNDNPVPTYVITVGTNALSTVRSENQLENTGSGSQRYYYTGLAGAAFDPDTTPADNIRWILEETTGGYYIRDYLTGNYLNATYTQNDTGGYSGDLKLDSTKDVWVLDATLDSWEVDGSLLKSTNASSTASSAKYLAYEDNQNLFTVRSESSADTTTLVEAEDPVAVTGVTVDPTSATIEVRNTVQLTATVTPEEATNKNVTWESSNKNIATVDENGLVRGVAEGDVEITVKTVDGNKTATCAVHVDPRTSADPDYTIVIDGYALSTDRSPNTAQGGSSGYTYTGLAGVEYATADTSSEKIRWTIEETAGGYYIRSLDGRYLNATYTSGTNSGTGDLKLDNTKDVWVLDNGYSLESGIVDGSKLKSTNASATASNGDKFLSYEDGQNLFTVRSEGNADTITIVDSTYEIVERFVETDTLENDKEYIIVATKNAGSYAVQNTGTGTSTGNTGSAVVTVNPASGSEEAYIETQDTTIVWKYASSTQYLISVSGTSGNTTRYLGYESSTYLPRVSSQGRAITYSGGKFQITSGHYLTCDNSGTFSTTTTETSGIRIFVRTKAIISCEHVWNDGEVTTKPTCTKPGVKTYTCTLCGEKKTEAIDALGHDMTHHDAVAATCTEPGNIEYWSCNRCGDLFEDEDGNIPVTQAGTVLDALGHDYGAATYEWAEDYSSVTGTRVCANDASHKITKTVNTTSEVTKPATCEAKGETTYTATFTDEGFTTQTKTVENVNALGHAWGAPAWEWVGNDSNGYTSATATFTCANDATHTETATDSEIDVETIPATPTENGSKKYTASVTGPDDKTYTDTKTVVIPATQYTFRDPEYTWTGDDENGYTAVEAVKECVEDQALNITETVVPVYTEPTPATCTEPGEGLWTATFSTTDFEVQTKPTTIAALGHDYGEATYEWAEDYSSVTGTRVCANDASHKITKTVNTTSEVTKQATCEAKGETTYTATFTDEGFATQTKTVENVDALGHDYEGPVWDWTGDDENGYTAATATFTCSKCNDVQVVDATVSGPEDLSGGGVKYTATAEFNNNTYTDTRVVGDHTHILTKTEAKAATCDKPGNIEYWTCSECGKYFSDEAGENEITQAETVEAAFGHDYGNPVWTWAKDYTSVTLKLTCSRDKTHVKTFKDIVPTIETTDATCTKDGKTVYKAKKKYEGNWYTAEKTVTIDKLGHDYGEYQLTRAAKVSKSGLLTKTCSRCDKKVKMVIPAVVAKVTSNTSTKATFTWLKTKGAQRYKIYFASCGKDSVSYLATTKELKYVKTGLTKGVCYKVKIKAQRKIDGTWTDISTSYLLHFTSGNVTKNSKYTNPKSISVAKASVSLAVGKTSTIKPTMTLVKADKQLLEKSHAVQYRYLSDNTNIATVNSDGKITAKKAGSCTVYVIGVNGVYKAISVTVK